MKGKNLLRDARATLCVQDERPPFAFLTLEGHVELLVRFHVDRAVGAFDLAD